MSSDYSPLLDDSYVRVSLDANVSDNSNPSRQGSFAAKKKLFAGSAPTSPTKLHPLKLMIFRGTTGNQFWSSINEIAKELDMILQLPNEMPEVNSACL